MFIKSSIQEKNVKRAKNELIAFSQEHKHKVTTFVANDTGWRPAVEVIALAA